MDKYRTLAANTALLSAGTLGSKVLVFLMVRFYTGYLTPSEYGTADLITQTANLLIPLVSLDITDGVFRFAAERYTDKADVFSVGVKTVAAGSAALLTAAALSQMIPAVGQYAFLLAFFVIASCFHGLCAHFVRARGDTALFAVQGLINTALYIGLNILFLAVLGWGIRGYVLSTAAANLITALLLIKRERLWQYFRTSPCGGLKREMLRYCVPLIPTAVFWWVMGVSDRYMVELFLGSGANGIYAVANKIPTIVTILASVFMDAWQLSAIGESSGETGTQLRFYGRVWDAFSSAIFLCAGCITALSPLLIRLLADEAYFESWRYVPMLTLSMASAALSSFLGSVYVVKKRSTASLWTSLAGAAVNIALNLHLIPLLGIQGAALATFLSCLAVLVIRLVSARRLMPFPLSWKKLLLSGAALLLLTGFTLLRPAGAVPGQLFCVALLALMALPAAFSAARMILHRRWEE